MSQLEVNVVPIVQRLVAGEEVRAFSDADVELLARWAAKTAAVLSYVMPQLNRVPKDARMSVHPDRRSAPKFRFFHTRIAADMALEGGFLQLLYGSEVGLVGTNELPGTRITLSVYNQLFTVDFPPIVEGTSYDLRESCSALLWPCRVAAGIAEMNVHAPIEHILFAICCSIRLRVTPNDFRS